MTQSKAKNKLTGQGGPGRGQGRKKGVPVKPENIKKVPLNTRVHPLVKNAIADQGNQAAYIEKLVCEDQNIKLDN